MYLSQLIQIATIFPIYRANNIIGKHNFHSCISYNGSITNDSVTPTADQKRLIIRTWKFVTS